MNYDAEGAIRILQGRLQPDRPRIFVQADVMVCHLNSCCPGRLILPSDVL